MVRVLANVDLFDGQAMQGCAHIIVDEGKIAEIRDVNAALPLNADVIDLKNKLVAPGFVDVQVNGGGGVMFNNDRSVSALTTMASGHRKFGTTTLIPTLITDDIAVMREAADAVRLALTQNIPGIRGIHFEGPCLNPERKGVHDPEKMRKLGDEIFAIYSGAGLGQVIVTLAPEVCGTGDIAKLIGAGIHVSVGHSQATADEVLVAIGAGVSGVTHLFNAMPPLINRAPGVVGVALSQSELWAGLIADGVHVADASARAAIAAKGRDKIMLVTDAMGTIGSAEKSFTLYGTEIFETDGKCVTADGTLAGSALDMMQAVRNTHQRLGQPLEDALRMASLTPAAFLGLDTQIGRIAEGFTADIVVIDRETLIVKRTFVGGQ